MCAVRARGRTREVVKSDNGGMKSEDKIHALPCVVLSLSAEEDEGSSPAPGLPGRIRLLHWGENRNANGVRVVVGEELVRALEDEAYPYRRIALDFEHNTVPGTPEYEHTKEPRSIAAYGDVECVPGKGVFLRIVRWTPDGEAHARDYEDVSAAPLCDAEGHVRAIPSAALCRTGAVPGTVFRESPLSAAPRSGRVNGNETELKTEVKVETQMNYREKLLSLLGLAPEASDEEIESALAALKEREEAALKQERSEEGLDERLEALSARLEAQSAELKRVAEAQLHAEKERLLDGARSAGKVVALSAEVLQRLSPEDLRGMIEATPATVPLSARTPATVRELPGSMREQAREIARLCGVAEEVLQ